MKNLMRALSLAVFALLNACAGPRVTLPIQVSSLSHLDVAAQEKVRLAIVQLNERSGETLIKVAEEGQSGNVTISITESVKNAGNKAHSGGTLAGRADLSGSVCSVELAEFLVTDERKELMSTIIWHEIGHCLGLKHDPNSGEIMSELSIELGNYSEGSVNRFLNTVKLFRH